MNPPSALPSAGGTTVKAFHLAWHTKHISWAAGREVLHLLLLVDVPPEDSLFLKIQIISDSDRPMGSISSQLACLRDPATRDGRTDPDEEALIAKLRERAAQTRHTLPAILPTREKPPWSRASLSRMARLTLVRSAGVA